MNKRAIIKKIIKRRNKYNHYYGYLKIIFKGEFNPAILDVGVNYFCNDNICIVQMKEKCINYDVTCILKNLKGNTFKIR